MGYKTNEIGYPADLLASRAIIERGNFALIPPEGLVKNTIPDFNNCEMTILGSPKLGASFVDYVGCVLPRGGNQVGFTEEGIECFIYVLDGELTVTIGEESERLKQSGFAYCPPQKQMAFQNHSEKKTQIYLYKKRYEASKIPLPDTVFGHSNAIKAQDYEGMSDVGLQDLLPNDLNFDVNFHILTFQTGASHGYVETHYQEHGALILSGEGMYNLDNHWIPIKKDDYIYMGPYNLQACYSVGRHAPLSYLYSKNCNRDVAL